MPGGSGGRGLLPGAVFAIARRMSGAVIPMFTATIGLSDTPDCVYA